MPIQNMGKKKKACSPRSSVQKKSTNANSSKNESNDEENKPSTSRAAAGTAAAASKPSKAENNKREAISVSRQLSQNEPSTSRASNNAPKKATTKPTEEEINKMSLPTMKATTNIRAIATKKAKTRNKTQKPAKAVVDRFIDQIYAQRHKTNSANRSKLGLDELVYIEKRAKAKKRLYLGEGGEMVTVNLVSSDEDVAMETNMGEKKVDDMEASDDETLAEYVKKSTKEQIESGQEAELTGALPQIPPAPEILSADHSTNSTESPPPRQTDEINTIDVVSAYRRKSITKPTKQSDNTSNKGREEVVETGKADERTWRIASDFQREIFEFTYEEFVAHTNIVSLQRKWIEANHPGKDFLQDDEVCGLKFYYRLRLNLKRWRRSILKNLKYKMCACNPNKTFNNKKVQHSHPKLKDNSTQHNNDTLNAGTQTRQEESCNQEDNTPDSPAQNSPSVFAHVDEVQMSQLTALYQPTQDPLRTQNDTEIQTAATPNENLDAETVDQLSNNTPSTSHTGNTKDKSSAEFMDVDSADGPYTESDDSFLNKAIKTRPAALRILDSSDDLGNILKEMEQSTRDFPERSLLPANQQTQEMDQTTLIDILSQPNRALNNANTASDNQSVVDIVHKDSPATKRPLTNISNKISDGQGMAKSPVRTVKSNEKQSDASKKRTLTEKPGPKSKKRKPSSNDDTLSTIEPPRYTYDPLEFVANKATNSTTFGGAMPNESVEMSKEQLIEEVQFSSPENSGDYSIEDESSTEDINLSLSNNRSKNKSILDAQQTLNENNTMFLDVLTQPVATIPPIQRTDSPGIPVNEVVVANAENESADPWENIPIDAGTIKLVAAEPQIVSFLKALIRTPTNLRGDHRFEFLHNIDITNVHSNLSIIRELYDNKNGCKEIVDLKLALRCQCNGANRITISGESPQKSLSLNTEQWEAARKILGCVRNFACDPEKSAPAGSSLLYQTLHYLFKAKSKFSSTSYTAYGNGQVFESTYELWRPNPRSTSDRYVLTQMKYYKTDE